MINETSVDANRKQPSANVQTLLFSFFERVRGRLSVRTTSSFLVSLIVHTSLLILLGLITYGLRRGNHDKAAFDLYFANASSDREADFLLEAAVPADFELPTELQAEIQSERLPTVSENLAANLSNTSVELAIATEQIASTSTAAYNISAAFTSEASGQIQTRKARGKGSDFFGIPASGNKIVFIVDCSESMRGGRFEDARAELVKTIRSLSSGQSFYIVFFAQNTYRMAFPPDWEEVPGLVEANYENIDAAEEWIKNTGTERWTDPFEAVVFAISLQPDVIFLLSDGEFTDAGRTTAFLRVGNDYRSKRIERPAVVINTVGFYSRRGEKTLKQIATAYKGVYRYVPQNKSSVAR